MTNRSKECETVGDYCVVQEGTGLEGSNHFGIRTWSCFLSPDSMEEWCQNRKSTDTIIAKGVSREEAQELCDQTSMWAKVYSAIRHAHTNESLLPQSYEDFVKEDHIPYIQKKLLQAQIRRLVRMAIEEGRTTEYSEAFHALAYGLV